MRNVMLRGLARLGWGLLLLGLMVSQRGRAQVAQNWFFVTTEKSTASVTLPAGATYRFGIANCPATSAPAWAQVTVTAATTISPVSMASGNPFPFADPCPYHTKELDVLELPAAQAIVLSDAAATPKVTGLVVPPASGAPVLAGGPHTVMLTGFTDAGGNSSALMLGATNQPPNGASATWTGTQMQLSIDGVVLTCSYGTLYAAGVYTLSCAN